MAYQVWPGSQEDGQALAQAIQNNCACTYSMGVRTHLCPAYTMFLEDERALKGLLFAKYLTARLIAEEHGAPTDQ